MKKDQFDRYVKEMELSPTSPNLQIIEALEPYRAKRAIFLAAGFGSRLLPITINTPKPLIKVDGLRIIDSAIDACLKVGIEEIYIVRGYLKEQFDTLLDKYPMIKFIDNPEYDKANNISSANVACHLFENAYVLEADLLITNPDIIKRYHYCSDVLGIKVDASDDWCMTMDADGYVLDEQLGGNDCYQMVGIYYWSKKDARKLAQDIQKVYHEMPGGRERYWETVPNQVFKGKYKIKIIPCLSSDVTEIDTFKELQEIDPAYIV